MSRRGGTMHERERVDIRLDQNGTMIGRYDEQERM
jgi:hypothetical protein